MQFSCGFRNFRYQLPGFWDFSNFRYQSVGSSDFRTSRCRSSCRFHGLEIPVWLLLKVVLGWGIGARLRSTDNHLLV